MKNIQSIILDKYRDENEYEKISESVYRNIADGSYKITLSCELEEGEDSQYPLEDILDKYYVNCTDYFEESSKGETTVLIFELEGNLSDDQENYENIMGISSLVGKRVYNKEDGKFVKLVIE